VRFVEIPQRLRVIAPEEPQGSRFVEVMKAVMMPWPKRPVELAPRTTA
jgi:hypothetical protein